MSLSHEERKERRKLIAECVAKHGMFKAMEEFKVSRNTVESSCAEYGVKINEIINHKQRKQMRETAANMCRSMTIEEVAKELKVSEANVRMACHEFGVSPIKRKPPGNLGSKSFRIVKLMLDGMTQSDIGRELNVSRQYVEQVRDKAREAGFVFGGGK